MKATILRSSRGGEVVRKYVKAATSNQHVVPSNGEWVVKKANSDRITKAFDRQREVITQAIKIAIDQKSEVVVHGRNEKMRENFSGKDSFPPRG